MSGLVEKFEKWKTKLSDRKQTRVNDKVAKNIAHSEYGNSSHSVSPPSSPAYREGWDRIFGEKAEPPSPEK